VDFLIARDDLHRCRFEEAPELDPGDGEAVLAVESFGLTANNVTYAKFGEAMSYWSFFPGPAGWGRMPVWGFARVAASRADGLEPGARVYGYLPPSGELLVAPPGAGPRGFVDRSPHRAALPAAYNVYSRVESDPFHEPGQEDIEMLLRPLFLTSWLIDDFLSEAEIFGADAVAISSASSRTASALAYLLAARGAVEVVGLTSPARAEFTRRLGVYDQVAGYEEAEALPEGRAVYVDIAGDAGVREAVHGRYGEALVHSAVVGATHHDRMGEVPDGLPGPRPKFFFAPERAAKRSGDWGRDGLEERLAEAWRPYATWAEGWLQVVHGQGPEALERAYLDVLDGRIEPDRADVLTLQG
jgi:hypothetical protein